MIQNLLDFLPLLILSPALLTLVSEADAGRVWKRRSRRCAVLLAGHHRQDRQGRGMPASCSVGEDSIRQALDEARRIVMAGASRHAGATTESHAGVCLRGHHAVNSGWTVTVFNPSPDRDGDPAGQSARPPRGGRDSSIRLDDVLRDGSEALGTWSSSIGKVVVNRIPSGSGAGCRRGGHLPGHHEDQSMEERIRREIYSQGHVAKFVFEDLHGNSAALRGRSRLPSGMRG